MLLAFLIDMMINLYIIFLLLRALIDEREFFFNPMLQPVYRVTEPVLRLFHGAVTVFERVRLLPVLVIIALLVVGRGALLHFLTPRVLLHSVLSIQISFLLSAGIVQSIVLSMMNFVDFFFQALLVFLVSGVLQPPHSTNALCRFIRSVNEPIVRFVDRLVPNQGKWAVFTAIILLLVAHMLVSGFFLITLQSSGSGSYGSFIFSPSLMVESPESPRVDPTGSPRQLGQSAVVFSSLSLAFRSFSFFTIILIVGAVMSWIRPDPFNPLVQWIGLISATLLAPLRRIMPLFGGIDLSPLVAILLIEFCREGLTTFFYHLLLGSG